MKTFVDSAGRSWTLTVNVDALRRVRQLTGVNPVADLVDGTLFDSLATDPVLLCDLLYAVCKPQADAVGVSSEQFGQAMIGDAIHDATMAFLESLVDFFPTARRNVLQKLLARIKEADKSQLELAEVKLKQLEQKLGEESSSLPESSALTPAP